MIRVVIADDHRMLLEGLSQALDGLPDIEVVGTAEDGQALLDLMEIVSADVLLVDLEMPRLKGTSALKRMDNLPPAIVVTMHTDDSHRGRARSAGAVGFLSKSAPLPDLAAAVRAADAGVDLFEVADLQETLDAHRHPQLSEGAAAVTGRERELLVMLADGVTTTEDLAERLYISRKTVKNHLASIYEKLGVNDRAQAALEAIKLGMNRAQ